MLQLAEKNMFKQKYYNWIIYIELNKTELNNACKWQKN